jgi:predicted dinucleotide-binding enzyme
VEPAIHGWGSPHTVDGVLIKLAVLGAGNVGHAVAALAGSRPGVGVTLWSRRFRHNSRTTIRVHGRGGTFGVADVTLAASPRKAVEDADIVLLTVPTHVRHELLARLTKQLQDCALLVTWEGMV